MHTWKLSYEWNSISSFLGRNRSKMDMKGESSPISLRLPSSPLLLLFRLLLHFSSPPIFHSFICARFERWMEENGKERKKNEERERDDYDLSPQSMHVWYGGEEKQLDCTIDRICRGGGTLGWLPLHPEYDCRAKGRSLIGCRLLLKQ